VPENVFSAYLVVEQVEAVIGLRLRLTIELSLKGPDLFRCFQAHRQSPRPLHLQKRTRSQGPSLHRHYPASTVQLTLSDSRQGRRLHDVEAAALAHDGSPPITRITFPTCRAHYPGEPNGCSHRFLPRSRGLPRYAGGSASAPSLSRPARASLALRPVGLLGRQGDLCHEAPAQPVARPSRSSATSPIDNFLGGTFLHW
jgi:hypothetical protein